jgi:hypothetical protein
VVHDGPLVHDRILYWGLSTTTTRFIIIIVRSGTMNEGKDTIMTRAPTKTENNSFAEGDDDRRV